jgi:hypothetical protein
VCQRFGPTYEQYPGLYWSHFQAALDWPDAEMWLEGAVQNGWSIARMRQNRWEAIGAPPDKKPGPGDVISSELDEDVDPGDDSAVADSIDGALGEVRPAEAAPSGSSAASHDETMDDISPERVAPERGDSGAEPPRPFEDLPVLPSDLSEAFESFKLAILHHKLSGWQEVSCDDVLAVLSALRELVLTPPDD